MEILGKIDEIGKPAWIGLLVLSLILFWPIGLALLAFLIWSGRMGCGKHRGRWHGLDERKNWSAPWRRDESSGNRAFDEYRAETLRKLEEEQREFQEFLERLRHAKDKAEFDDFMAERRRRGDSPAPPPAA
jgi:hypothetical protein